MVSSRLHIYSLRCDTRSAVGAFLTALGGARFRRPALHPVDHRCLLRLRVPGPHASPSAGGSQETNYRWMPPSARIHDGPAAVAEKEGPAVAPGSADVRGTGQWQLAPAAYGVGWYVLLALAVALPNAKWADMKYAEFDSREHIGMGYSTACSVMFMEDVDWALEPSTGDALARHLEDCTADLEEQCSASGGRLSATPGGNSVYENSWKGCSNATTGQWEEKCLTITGCGGLHEEQCANVSRAVERPYSITYGSGAKWSKAAGGSPYCIPVGSLCEDVDRVTAAGVLGAVGAALAGLGLLAILSYCFLGGGGSSRRRALVAAGLALSAAWAALLASWLLFHHALGHVTTCYVQADHNNGIVAATGPLGDIVNPGGSYSYYCVVGAWALLTPVMLAAWARAAAELRGGGHAGPNGATEAAAAAAAAAPKGQDAEAAAGAQAGFCAPTGPSIEAAPCGALGSPGANGSHAGAIGPDQVHVQVGADRHNASGVGPEPEQPLGAPDALGVLFAPSSGAGSPPGDAAGADAGRGVDRRTIHCLCNGVPICVPRTR
ncbi:unnamed protein product [Prorocentrum cordatum]|uniref:Claudin n=1 Tax=Prorocentrum cordatum TaxID=2364126 RepID=A0ABN9WN90_9DINO|nr:unnamed protein product [Polarella glacialis]